MVVQGHENTLPVSLDEMIYHAEMVGRAAERAMVVVDLPFPTNHLGIHSCVAAAGRILKETRCQAVKLEGGADQADVIQALVGAGIPVMAHVGLRPQSVHAMGGYKVQRDEERLLEDAMAAQAAGAFAMVVECVPVEVAQRVTEQLAIPTIGIGAGPHCDGQVLVLPDMLGITQEFSPRFLRRYLNMGEQMNSAIQQYVKDVRSRDFPNADEQY